MIIEWTDSTAWLLYTRPCHVKCLIELGKLNEAKFKIDKFSKDMMNLLVKWIWQIYM